LASFHHIASKYQFMKSLRHQVLWCLRPGKTIHVKFLLKSGLHKIFFPFDAW